MTSHVSIPTSPHLTSAPSNRVNSSPTTSSLIYSTHLPVEAHPIPIHTSSSPSIPSLVTIPRVISPLTPSKKLFLYRNHDCISIIIIISSIYKNTILYRVCRVPKVQVQMEMLVTFRPLISIILYPDIMFCCICTLDHHILGVSTRREERRGLESQMSLSAAPLRRLILSGHRI